PCNWTASSGLMERDTTNPHSGSASLKLTIEPDALAANALSDCNPITPGSPSLSFWYRTADAKVTSVFLLLLVYTSSNCSGFFQNAGGPMTIFPTTDGAWHQLGPTSVAVPAGSNSAKLSIGDECTSTCA